MSASLSVSPSNQAQPPHLLDVGDPAASGGAHSTSASGNQLASPDRSQAVAEGSSVLAWRIPWTEEPGGLYAWGCKEFDTTEQLTVVSVLELELNKLLLNKILYIPNLQDLNLTLLLNKKHASVLDRTGTPVQGKRKRSLLPASGCRS